MTYQEELLQQEWTLKRLEILERDNFKCQRCFTERPVFRGLVKSFGIVTFEQLLNKGYSTLNLDKDTFHYDNLHFINDGWANQALYIGDKTQNFELQKLLFALQSTEVKIFNVVKKGYRLICFYKEAIAGQLLIDLNIHHKYYIVGHKPWEYENDALISLCIGCHKLTHEETETIVYTQQGDKLYTTEICDRCAGAGYLPEFEYHMNGICFQCWGEGVIIKDEKSIS